MLGITRQVGVNRIRPGIIRFYWKVSSQLGGDYVEFFIDSVRQARISGTTDWQGQSYTITGSGTHTLKWRYTKNGWGTGGSDCAWVDYVQSPSPTDWLTITYAYDSAGRRIEKAYDGQTVMKYLYDGGHIIAEYDGNNSLLHKYIYGPGVDQPICMIDVENSSATYYYHFDGLGSVVALTNSAGSVVNLYEYSVYGEVSASDPNHPNRFLFTGREFDADTGLYYYRARYYNPYIGRFLQTDPAGDGDGSSLYQYCGNNPVTYSDPLGQFYIRDPGMFMRMLPPSYGPWHTNRNLWNRAYATVEEMRMAAIDHPDWWEKEEANPFHWPDTYRGKGPYEGCQASYFPRPDDSILNKDEFARYYDPAKAGMLDDVTPYMGTYDYFPPYKSKWGHFWYDVYPHTVDKYHYTPGMTTIIHYTPPSHANGYCPYDGEIGPDGKPNMPRCPVCDLCPCYCLFAWTGTYCTVLNVSFAPAG